MGAAAGLGAYLGMKDSLAKNFSQFKKELDKVIHYISSSRPTAKNLFPTIQDNETQIKSLKKLRAFQNSFAEIKFL